MQFCHAKICYINAWKNYTISDTNTSMYVLAEHIFMCSLQGCVLCKPSNLIFTYTHKHKFYFYCWYSIYLLI